MGKRVVLATFGSLGDLHPFIAVAQALKQRGIPAGAGPRPASYPARRQKPKVRVHPVKAVLRAGLGYPLF